MVTLGAEAGDRRAHRPQNEGGERGGRPAGAVSPTPAPREAAQPPEHGERQQVVSRQRRAAQLGAKTPSRCPENLVHLETKAARLFLWVSLRYLQLRRARRGRGSLGKAADPAGRLPRSPPRTGAVRREPWRQVAERLDQRAVSQTSGWEPRLRASPLAHGSPLTLTPEAFAFLGKGEGRRVGM